MSCDHFRRAKGSSSDVADPDRNFPIVLDSIEFVDSERSLCRVVQSSEVWEPGRCLCFGFKVKESCDPDRNLGNPGMSRETCDPDRSRSREGEAPVRGDAVSENFLRPPTPGLVVLLSPEFARDLSGLPVASVEAISDLWGSVMKPLVTSSGSGRGGRSVSFFDAFGAFSFVASPTILLFSSSFPDLMDF